MDQRWSYGTGMRMGMDGALWDVGFGVGWMTKYGDMGHRDGWVPMGSEIWGRVDESKGGFMGPGWDNMGHSDGWGPTGSGIWGRVDQRWSYGTGKRM